MTEYYFDIETTGLNPDKDSIVSIQFNIIGFKFGFYSDKFGEEKLLKDFVRDFNTFFVAPGWDIIPVGWNIYNFDLPFLLRRLKKYGLFNGDFYDKPVIDLRQHFIAKSGFKGTKLSDFGKKHDGSYALKCIKERDYDKLVEYTLDEYKVFCEVYEKVKDGRL